MHSFILKLVIFKKISVLDREVMQGTLVEASLQILHSSKLSLNVNRWKGPSKYVIYNIY